MVARILSRLTQRLPNKIINPTNKSSYQSLSRTKGPSDMSSLDSKTKLDKLRGLMKERDLDAYVVPSEDAHASEYLAPCDARRAFITAFTGSAGTAVITKDQARCWTDGRYWLQAEKQLGEGWILMKAGLPEVLPWTKWVQDELPKPSKIGIDPTVLSFSEFQTLSKALAPKDPSSKETPSTLVPVIDNLVDMVWNDKPARPNNPVFRLADEYTGQSVAEKLSSMREKLKWMGCPGIVVGQLDEVAWLFNLRGTDIPYNPVFFAYTILTINDCKLFTNPPSLSPDVKAYLHEAGVEVQGYEQFWNTLHSWAADVRNVRDQALDGKTNGVSGNKEHEAKMQDTMVQAGKDKPEEKKDERKDEEKLEKTDKVLLGNRTSWAIAEAIGEKHVEVRRSMVEDAKAKKNDVEVEGFRQCHIRDGAALIRYFAWLEEVLQKGEKWTEYNAATVLENYRKENDKFMGLSFDTISSTGPNAAVIHYSPPEQGSAEIDVDQMYLCDSGAQYLDGTTDTTRTWHFGSPSDKEKRAFTRVLQGHIDLDMMVFPKGTTGYLLDPIARRPLWLDGLDYRHGTGHGVGAFLNVHEGPQGVGQRIAYNDVPLQIGHVISNEPGYYADGKWGIRIENVVVVKKVDTTNRFGDRDYLGFEHFTMCPMHLKLILPELLAPEQRKWLNNYHAEVREKVTPLLSGFKDERALRWLDEQCKAI